MGIRTATYLDTPEISKCLFRLNFDDALFFREDNVEIELKSHFCFVYTDDDDIAVGVILLKLEDFAVEIYALAVDADSKIKGVGKALIEYAEKFGNTAGRMFLYAYSYKRYKVKGFYEKVGFKAVEDYSPEIYTFAKLLKVGHQLS